MKRLNDKIELTSRFDDWIRFYQTSKLLQDNCVIGDETDASLFTSDPHFLKHDYLWSGDTMFQDVSRCIYNHMIGPTGLYRPLVDSMYMMFVHRICGSGASYKPGTHGITNTPLTHFDSINIVDMTFEIQQLHADGIPMFSSAACQIPMFPKSCEGQYRCDPYPQGVTYLIDHAPVIIGDLERWLLRTADMNGPVGHLDIVEFLANWHKSKGFTCFWFQFHLFSVDLSDWFPNLVNCDSATHWGTGATNGINTTYKKIGRISKKDAINAVSEYTTSLLGYPMKWNESMACLFFKYINM